MRAHEWAPGSPNFGKNCQRDSPHSCFIHILRCAAQLGSGKHLGEQHPGLSVGIKGTQILLSTAQTDDIRSCSWDAGDALPADPHKWPTSTSKAQCLTQTPFHLVASYQCAQEGSKSQPLQMTSLQAQKGSHSAGLGEITQIWAFSTTLGKESNREAVNTQSGFAGWREGYNVCSNCPEKGGNQCCGEGLELECA